MCIDSFGMGRDRRVKAYALQALGRGETYVCVH